MDKVIRDILLYAGVVFILILIVLVNKMLSLFEKQNEFLERIEKTEKENADEIRKIKSKIDGDTSDNDGVPD